MFNLPTIIMASVIFLIVLLICHKMYRDKQNGKSSCGCNCANCHGSCHTHK